MIKYQYNPSEIYAPAGRSLTEDEYKEWFWFTQETDSNADRREFVGKQIGLIKKDIRSIFQRIRPLESMKG